MRGGLPQASVKSERAPLGILDFPGFFFFFNLRTHFSASLGNPPGPAFLVLSSCKKVLGTNVKSLPHVAIKGPSSWFNNGSGFTEGNPTP